MSLVLQISAKTFPRENHKLWHIDLKKEHQKVPQVIISLIPSSKLLSSLILDDIWLGKTAKRDIKKYLSSLMA